LFPEGEVELAEPEKIVGSSATNKYKFPEDSTSEAVAVDILVILG
jgi:hypothetical protein